MSSESRGQLFVVSAPSGTGKTTLVERLVQTVPNLMLSRSFTSRAPRAGEQDGVDYNFISRERFETMKDAGEFLEYADVFGNYYGTSATATEAALASGRDLVLVIDVQGARQVRARASAAVGIFVLPPFVRGARESVATTKQGLGRADPPPPRRRTQRGRRRRRL